jgi:16S rRNA (guanine(966)-N(2))-methyltransferase RsmD
MRVITGSARGIRLKTPDGLKTRPTTDRVKEAVFSIIQFEIEGGRFLDLFAGTGQMGIEALSRGAVSAVFVDGWKEACALVRENLRLTRLADRAKVVQSDYMTYLQRCQEKFDVIFLDPPYAEIFLENALNKISEIDILSDRGIIICERPAEKQLDLEIPGLQRTKDYKYGQTWITIFRKA